MKLSKKILSAALASVLSLSMAVSAFAGTSAQVAPTTTTTEAPTVVKAVESGVVSAAAAKDFAAKVTVKDTKLTIKKNALKGSKVTKIVAKNIKKAKNVKFKGKAGKKITIIFSKKIKKSEQKKIKDKAKKAGVKVKFK